MLLNLSAYITPNPAQEAPTIHTPYSYMLASARGNGLIIDALAEGAPLKGNSIPGLLDTAPYRTPSQEALEYQTMLCDSARKKYPALSQDNDAIISAVSIQMGLDKILEREEQNLFVGLGDLAGEDRAALRASLKALRDEPLKLYPVTDMFSVNNVLGIKIFDAVRDAMSAALERKTVFSMPITGMAAILVVSGPWKWLH